MPSRRWRLALVVATGCFGLEDPPSPADGAADGAADDASGRVPDAPPGDAPVTADAAPPACDLDAPFSTPTPVAELNSSTHEWSARRTSDDLGVFLASYRSGVNKIYFASR